MQIKFSISFLVFVFLSTIASTGLPEKAHGEGEIQFIPEGIDYGFTLVDVCVPKRICAINNTNQPISDPNFQITENRNFSVQSSFQKCPNPLPPGEACIVYVDFCPEFVREYQGTLTFSGSAGETALLVQGKGSSPPP